MVMLTVDAVHDEIFQLRRGGLYNGWMGKGKRRDVFRPSPPVGVIIRMRDGAACFPGRHYAFSGGNSPGIAVVKTSGFSGGLRCG